MLEIKRAKLLLYKGELAEKQKHRQAVLVRFDEIKTAINKMKDMIQTNLEGQYLTSENQERETEGIEEVSERCDSVFFVEAFSTNSRSLEEYVEEVKVAIKAEGYRGIDAFSPSSKGSVTAPRAIQEHTIVDPIVKEPDCILQCTNQCEESGLHTNYSPSKNPKFRCIYTCAQAVSDQRISEINYSVRDSTLDSPKSLERDLAATYVISSGDEPPIRMVNDNSLINGDKTVDQGDSMLNTIPCDDSDIFGVDSLSELMLKTQDLEITKFNESKSVPEESVDKDRDSKSSSKTLSSLSLSFTPAEPSIPRKVFRDLSAEKEFLKNANCITYCVTPSKTLRELPKRKISVFHRSFEIDTLHAVGEVGSPETYRLTECSMSTLGAKQENQFGNKMDLDLHYMTKNPSTRTFLLNSYRTNANGSDSSGSLSPEKSLGYCRDMSLSVMVAPTRASKRSTVLAPKLKLPLLNDVTHFTSIEKKCTKSSNGDIKNEEKAGLPKTNSVENCDANLTENETYKLYDVRIADESELGLRETSQISEIIRPGDEVERGITYRRGSLSRESDCLSHSFLFSAESVSTVVSPSDGESTSSGSLFLLSTHEKPKSGEWPYGRKDPSKSHGLRQADRLTESGVDDGYQTRNDNISDGSSIGSYGSDGGGIRVLDEKPSVMSAVALAMSSGEDSSDSESNPMTTLGIENRLNLGDETLSRSPTILPFVNVAFSGFSTPAPAPTVKNNSPGERGDESSPRKLMAQKRDKREQIAQKRAALRQGQRRQRVGVHSNWSAFSCKTRLHTIRRSLSESRCGRSESNCHCTAVNSIPAKFNKEVIRPNAFPSLTDARLQETGIANLSSSDELGGSLTEADLERKYTALSVGLVTDRITLSRRMALSIRQRDQSERNLSCEVHKMHQDIQELAPLCIDRESVQRVERVKRQLEMIKQCAHRISCTAETLGAVHQEHRISRAILFADRYLLLLRSRCEKLASDLAETKRVLTENNIVVEENNGELGDDLPRIRYRGMPTNNRTMMARRRASIATIFRPLGNFQDATKDGIRQRNSVSGKVPLRRPSLSVESQKWETEKLDRTDSSSSSIGELREIFEQAESRRDSREVNNNALRLHSSNLSIRDGENGEEDVWMSTREEPIVELLPTVDGYQEFRPEYAKRRTSQPCTAYTNVPWKPILWCILISFLLGFYIKHVVSSVNGCSGTALRWWSIEEIFGRYGDIKNDAPRPI